MTELFSLGELYPSDFLRPGESPRCEPVELKLIMEDRGLVRLEKTAPDNVMWGKYWYRSGINQTMKNELKSIVDSILPLMKWKEGDIWCDVACNDGTLLSFVPKSFMRVGIDPADDYFYNESTKHADFIIQDYFSANVFNTVFYGKPKVKVLTSIAMFYDVENPDKFIRDVDEILDDDGLWVMQLSYTPLMIHQNAFDNICHEHKVYYDLNTLNYVLDENGFRIIDCQLNDINGGSFRVYIMKKRADFSKFGTQPYRDVCAFRLDALFCNEGDYIKDERKESWYDFFNKITELRNQTVSFVREQKAAGKTIWGYGASTKGNTLLQYFGLDNTLITGIAERNPDKWGLRTIGTNIPIYPESDMRKAKPDYLLVLPWHFINEFQEREKDYLAGGGHFIVPCPKFQII
jgi:hypothetical protein